MATQTQTIDCQVHCYARNTPERPWRNHLEGPDEVTGDDMVAAMDAVGVDGAILISPFSLYGYDPRYILGVYDQHPGRFRLLVQATVRVLGATDVTTMLFPDLIGPGGDGLPRPYIRYKGAY